MLLHETFTPFDRLGEWPVRAYVDHQLARSRVRRFESCWGALLGRHYAFTLARQVPPAW
jgi:hypothetical protein